MTIFMEGIAWEFTNCEILSKKVQISSGKNRGGSERVKLAHQDWFWVTNKVL